MKPIFKGQNCLHGNLELRKDLGGAWQVAALWDVGKVHGEPNLLSSVGAAIRYRTPVGITIEGGYSRNLSTDHQAWRFGVGASY